MGKLKATLSDDTQLMEKDQQDASRRNETDDEEPHAKEHRMNRSPIGHLIAYHLPRHDPPHKDAGEEGAHRQENIGSQVITTVEKALTEKSEVNCATRQRA